MDLLLACRQVFHDTGDIQALGATLTALAHTEHQRGHGNAVIRFARDPLRYTYGAADTCALAVSYHNLGIYLHVHARQSAAALAAHLAAALIYALADIGGTGSQSATSSVRAAAADLREFGTAAEAPSNIADLCDRRPALARNPAELERTSGPADRDIAGQWPATA